MDSDSQLCVLYFLLRIGCCSCIELSKSEQKTKDKKPKGMMIVMANLQKEAEEQRSEPSSVTFVDRSTSLGLNDASEIHGNRRREVLPGEGSTT